MGAVAGGRLLGGIRRGDRQQLASDEMRGQEGKEQALGRLTPAGKGEALGSQGKLN